jgi:DNA anti-recombination protein RmuC
MNGLNGAQAAIASPAQTGSTAEESDDVNGGRIQELQKSVSEMAAQISKIESELKNDNSTLNDQLALLHKPREEQESQMESQISSQFDERRRSIKAKLDQLEEVVNKNP